MKRVLWAGSSQILSAFPPNDCGRRWGLGDGFLRKASLISGRKFSSRRAYVQTGQTKEEKRPPATGHVRPALAGYFASPEAKKAGRKVTILIILFCLVAAYSICGLAYFGLWVWWEFYENKPVIYSSPRLTPEKLNYPSKPETTTGPETSQPEPAQPAEPDPKQIERQRRWEEMQQRKLTEARAKIVLLLAEAAAIADNFPAWLVELADRRNIPKSFDNLQKLAEWVKYVLTFGQQELGGSVSVRVLFANLGGSDKASIPNAAGRDFFVDLLKILEREGIVDVLPTRSRKIPADFLDRLGCSAFGVQRATRGTRPILVYTQEGRFENLQNPTSLQDRLTDSTGPASLPASESNFERRQKTDFDRPEAA